MNYLMTKLGDDWSVHADASLIHADEYWSFCLDTDHIYLKMRNDEWDVTAGTLRQNFSQTQTMLAKSPGSQHPARPL